MLEKEYSSTVDNWSLGILAFELLTGSPPFAPTFSFPAAMKQRAAESTKGNIVMCDIRSRLVAEKIGRDASDLIEKVSPSHPFLLPSFKVLTTCVLAFA